MEKQPRYKKLSSHLRELFGCRVHRVAVDGGFTCPNRDGKIGVGGCLYCDEAGSRASYVEPRLPVREQVRRGIEQMRRRYKARKFLVYFQPYTNTYAPVERLRRLYDEALDHPDVVGLMIGTRADCLGDDVLNLLEQYHRRTYLWVELGLQSVSDATLRWIGRGHDFAAFERGAKQAKARGLRLCAHLIVGLPTDKREDHLAAADALNRLGFDGVKIHSLYVGRNSALGAMCMEKLAHQSDDSSCDLSSPFELMTRQDYVARVCDILERLDPRIVIHRLTSDVSSRDLLAPEWRLDKSGVVAGIEAEMERRNSCQGSKQAHGQLV
ncbi:TIGR01212 family radical SAM protein [Candidatus Sumerlaeota bacterium]|nr:TIGR01212 family radical SAM protein [Candidatus Sumerlaeota bacterium]